MKLPSKRKVSSILIFEIKLPLNSVILTQIPRRAETAPVAKTCCFFPISSKEVRGREGPLAAQSAIGIVWCIMSYAKHRKLVQEAWSAGSWEWQRQRVVQVPRDAKRMWGMRFCEWQWNMWSGTHRGNQGSAKRLCHMGKRWERQIGTKRQLELRELLSEVKVRGFCLWSLSAALGYSQLLVFLHPDSDLNRSWEQLLSSVSAYRAMTRSQRRSSAALSQSSLEATVQEQLLHPGQGRCQLPFSPKNATSEQACLFQNNSPAAALTTTIPKFRHTTKRRSGRTGAIS